MTMTTRGAASYFFLWRGGRFFDRSKKQSTLLTRLANLEEVVSSY